MRTDPATLARTPGTSLLLLIAGNVCTCSTLALADSYSANRENSALRFTDASNSRTLISPNGFTTVSDTQARTSITISNQPGGFDLVVTYTNPGSTPLPLGQINLGGIRFGQTITYRDFSHDAKVVNCDHMGNTGLFSTKEYPHDTYSPVFVISDGEYTLGTSLNYPVAEYNHRIDITLRSPHRIENDNGRNWMITYLLRDSLPAGQTRTYTIPVRVAKGSQHWLETLRPYRDYFRSLYGDVQYTRDARPVRGVHIAYANYLSPSNQRGFHSSNLDPSLNGFGPWANNIRANCVANGFDRVMIWAPTGVYYGRRDDNYPTLFMTGADNIPLLRDTQNMLRSVPDSGIQTGYWWGYSQNISPGGWDSGHTLINVDNPAHLALAWREMDRAVSLGTTLIGLDAFAQMEPAPALRYLRMLRERYPNVKYVGEVSIPDILHVYAASFVFGRQVTTPHYLADFLLPGHETWLMVGYDTIRPGETEAETRNREMQRAADMGYIPLANSNVPITPDLAAAEGWNALPDSVRPITNGGNTTTGNTLASGLSGLLTRSNGNRPDGGGNTANNLNGRQTKNGSPEAGNATGNSFAVTGLTKVNTPPDAANPPQTSGIPTGAPTNSNTTNQVLATGTEEALKAQQSKGEQSTLSGETTNTLAAGSTTTSGKSPAGRTGYTSPRTTVPPPPAATRGPSRVMKQSTSQVPYAAPGANGSPIPTIFTLRSPYVDAIKNVFPDSSKANAALRRASSPAESQPANASAAEK